MGHGDPEGDAIEAAGKVLDYNVNNAEMLKTVRLTMGAPTNPKVAEQAVAFARALLGGDGETGAAGV